MHTSSLLVASIAFFSTFAIAETEKPKFYFPRQVKRQVVNTAFPNFTPANPFSSKAQSSNEQSNIEKRSPIELSQGGLVPAIAAILTGGASSSAPVFSTSLGEAATIVASNTVVSDPETTSAPAVITSSAGSGQIILGPDTVTYAPTTTPAATTADPLGSVLSDLFPSPTVADTTAQQAAPTTVDTSIYGPTSAAVQPSSTPDAVSSILDGITGSATAPASSYIPADTTAVVPPTDSGSTPVTTASGGFPSESPVATTASGGFPSESPVATTASGGFPSDSPLPTTAVVPPTDSGSTPVTTASDGFPSESPVATTASGGFPSESPVATTASGVFPSDPYETTGTGGFPLPTETSSPTTYSGGFPSESPLATTASDGFPTAVSSDFPAPTSASAAPTDILVSASPSGSLIGSGLPTQTTDGSSATASEFVSTTPAPAPTSVEPTGTDGPTSNWIPTSIGLAPTASTDGTATTSVATGIPSSLPQVIAPPSGIPDVPADYTVIQVGFVYGLNYPFVVSHSVSAAQIFAYLPIGIADGLNLDLDKVVMQGLIPYDTTANMGYITTLALAYIPTSMVSTLAAALHSPLSALYTNPDGSVNTIMNLINPAIPLLPGTSISGGTSGTSGAPAATSSATTSNSGVFNTDDQNTSSAVKGTTAGIAVGAVFAATAYGAAMFFIARRYKRRKLGHRRASSMQGPEMTTGSPALMGGGAFMSGGRMTPGSLTGGDRQSRGSGRSNGNSARTAQISAPMAAENSLGWN